MRLEAIALQGITRFHDPVALNLRALPAGLIAIVGGNGEGKTTILESVPACLWRQFPSRGDKGLVDYVTRRDAYIEVTFTIDGQGTFRARLALDVATRQSEAVLEQVLDSGERRLLNDGKVSTYDQVIAQHLPPADLILASVFAAQNRAGSFTSQDRKARKQLFASLLGLDHYEVMATTAREAVRLVDEARTRAGALRDVLRQQTAPSLIEALHADATVLQTEMARVEVQQQQTDAQVPALRAEREALTLALQRHATLTAQQATQAVEASALTQRATSLPQQRAMRVTAHQAALAALDTARAAARAKLDAQGTTRATAHREACASRASAHTAAVAAIDEKIANNRAVLANGADIRAAGQTVTRLESEIAIARQTLTAADTAVTTTREACLQAEQTRDRLTDARQALLTDETTAALLSTVPCGGAGDFAGCALLNQARAARERLDGLPALELRLVRAREAARVTGVALDAAQEQRAAVADGIDRLTQDVVAPKKLAGLSDRLAAAEARIGELVGQRAADDARHAQAIVDAQADDDARVVALAADREDADTRHTAAVAAALVSHEATLSAIEADLADVVTRGERLLLEQQGLQAAIDAIGDVPVQARDLDRRLHALQDARSACAAAWATLAQQRLVTGRRRADVTLQIQRLAHVAAWVASLDVELLAWQRLATALGRDGLPVLEIDAAGPTVSTYCNDLLQACFGGRFSVELVTQEAKASGKGLKETFEIRVFDNTTGGAPRDLGDLSGGERVIVDEALKNAIAILLNQRAPSWPIRTCWRDETTGALDPENARRYVDMLRRMQQLAGIEQVFFVTHLGEAAGMADAQIVVANGTLTVRHAPYSVAA